MISGDFKNVIYKMCLLIIYLIFMLKEDLALNNLQYLICSKTKPTKLPTNQLGWKSLFSQPSITSPADVWPRGQTSLTDPVLDDLILQ